MKKILRRFHKKKTKNGIHVPTKMYQNFSNLIHTFEYFYNNQIQYEKPEYITIRSIFCSLQEIVELHLEKCLTEHEKRIDKKIMDDLFKGNLSFYKKYKTLHEIQIIFDSDFEILQTLKNVRNALVHLNEESCNQDISLIKPYATSKGLLEFILKVDKTVKFTEITSSQEAGRKILPPYINEILQIHQMPYET
jgi:hypothetical protein